MFARSKHLFFALMIAMALGAAPGPAVAAGGPPANPEEAAVDTGHTVEVPNLVIPVVRRGQLANYIYATVRIRTPANVDATGLREKGHFLRDAMLRASHRADLADPTRDDQLNLRLAIETFSRVAKEQLGAASVADVQLVFITPLRRVTTVVQR